MTKKVAFTIGHILNDTEPKPHIGGGAPYSGVALVKLGFETHIVAKFPSWHPYIHELESLGIEKVHPLPFQDPSFQDKVCSFTNIYDVQGNRTQKVNGRQEKITPKDIYALQSVLIERALVFITPVLNEVDPKIFKPLKERGHFIALTPQGYFRSLDEEGNVVRSPWQDVEVLKDVDAVILSDEDLTFDHKMDMDYFARMREVCDLIVLTKGKEGLSIYKKGQEPIDIEPFKLNEDELRDFTGAGDSCAASFVWHYTQRGNLREAGTFAALYSALKIKGVGGKEGGLSALPSLEQVHEFVQSKENESRYKRFLELNGLSSLSLLPEGNDHGKERL